MSAAQTILSSAIWLALAILAVAFLLTVWRVARGPTLPDRVVALDMLVGIVIGFIALIAIRTGFTLYIDIAIALGLVGFLATVAFARFILAQSVRAPARAAMPAAVGEGHPHGEANATKKIRRGKTAESQPPKTTAKSAAKAAAKPAADPATKQRGKSGEPAARSKKVAKPGKAE